MKKFAVFMILALLLLTAACSRTPAVTPTAAPTASSAPTDAPEDTASPGDLQPTPVPENASPGSMGGEQSGAATPGNLTPEEFDPEDSYWEGVFYDTTAFGPMDLVSTGESVNLRLLKGGKAIFRSAFWSPYAEESGPASWTWADGELAVTCRDGTLLKGGPEDGKLVLDYRGDALTLEKRNAAPQGEELGTELMKGSWVLASLEIEGYVSSAAEDGVRAYLRTDGNTADIYWHSENEKASWFEENMVLSVLWDALYPGCPNGYWQAELNADAPVSRGYSFTVEAKDRLVLRISSIDCASEEGYPSILTCVFSPVAPDAVEVMTAPEPVTVGTVEELMDALRDRATVLLQPGTYNVTEWLNSPGEKDLGTWAFVRQPHFAQGLYLSGFDDQVELTVAGLRELTIASADPEHPALIVCEPRYANVIAFFNCKNLSLRDVVMGHTPEPGFCMGAVLRLDYCSNALVEGCELYGCGTYGVTAESTWGLRIDRSEIRDCTFGCLDFAYVSDAFVLDTSFHDCEGYTMFCLSGSIVEFTGCDFRNLEADFLYLDEYAWASFEGCTFDKATAEALQNSPYGEDQLAYDLDAISASKG